MEVIRDLKPLLRTVLPLRGLANIAVNGKES